MASSPIDFTSTDLIIVFGIYVLTGHYRVAPKLANPTFTHMDALSVLLIQVLFYTYLSKESTAIINKACYLAI